MKVLNDLKNQWAQRKLGRRYHLVSINLVLRELLSNVKSLELVHCCMVIVAHCERMNQVTVENGGCEGVRTNEVLDFLLPGMDSLNLLPTEDSHPYHPSYCLWLKLYGEEEKWRLVRPAEMREVLRIACR